MNTSRNMVSTPELARANESSNPALVYVAGLGPGSRRSQIGALDCMARALSDGQALAATFPWHELTIPVLGTLRGWLESRYAPATANRHLAALKGVLKASWRSGAISSERYHRLVDIRPVPGNSSPVGRMLQEDEVTALVDVSRATQRVLSLVATMLETGMRASEVCSLDVGDYTKQGLYVRRSKGNKSRMVPVAASRQHLDLIARTLQSGPLFRTARGRRMDQSSLRKILRTTCAAAGVSHITPHDIRRTFISRLLEKGIDIATVSELAGHSSIETTKRYDRRPESARVTAIASLGYQF